MLHDHATERRPVLFGEVLVDQLPGGRAMPGGAPLNVAWHLQGFGLRPLLISRVGEDVMGEWLVRSMDAWGMDTSGLQCDPHHPTGTVQVRLDEGQPSFRILGDQAYDHIDAEAARAVLQRGDWSLLYHGTLAARGSTSCAALGSVREATDLPAFVDVNLRDPWWRRDEVSRLLAGARWLKLSRAELHQLAGTVMDDEPTLLAAGREFIRRYGLEWLLITDGGNGAYFLSGEGSGFQAAARATAVVDTVGAGDAFTAVCILGLARRWPLTLTVARASEFAAQICARAGATSNDPALYAGLLERWAS